MPTITGTAGNDNLTATAGIDTIDGGAGIDRLTLDRSAYSTPVILSITPGASTTFPDGTSFVNIEDLYLTTGAGNDSITFNHLHGEATWGGNSWDGGAGNDTVTADFSDYATSIYRTGDDGSTSFAFYDLSFILTLANVENCIITGGSYGNELRGGTGNNTLIGGAGYDELTGNIGNDYLDGGLGHNTIYGGGGNDTIIDRGAGSYIYAGTGNDTIRGIGSSNLVVDGEGGTDYFRYETASSVTGFQWFSFTPGVSTSIFGSGGGSSFSNIEYFDMATGSGDDDAKFVNPLPYDGALGFVNGFDGGNGNDTLSVDCSGYTTALSMVTGSTSGELSTNGHAFFSFAHVEILRITGGAADDAFRAGSGNDTLISGDGEDKLTGGAGNDKLDGGPSVDIAVVSGNRAAYTITQTSTGNFTVTGPDGTDTLTNIEYLKFDDQMMRLLPGSGTTLTWTADPSAYMGAIRDFDGNDLGGAASWKLIGTADVNGDGSVEHILFNREIGRWAEVGTEADGMTYFNNNGWAGDTRVVGIYIDPLVANGTVVKGSDVDSQRRFQNDLTIDNIHGILGQADYDHNGLQEIYFSLTDGTAFLHAYMHADGNIQYANYQSKQQVIDYLTSNGFGASTWSTWFAAT